MLADRSSGRRSPRRWARVIGVIAGYVSLHILFFSCHFSRVRLNITRYHPYHPHKGRKKGSEYASR